MVDVKEKFVENFDIAFNKIRKNKEYDEIIFLCVGTDRITGDCFGPLVGTKLNCLLEKHNYSNINIYGNLEKNISYTNVENILKDINNKGILIVVDSALSKKDNIGQIFIKNGKTTLGRGLGKSKIEIGDISIKAVIAKDSKIPTYNFKLLQNISLNSVMNMADVVANGIYEVIKIN